MRISVLIPSINRTSLHAVVGSLHGLASGSHEITYCVGVDDETPGTGYSGIEWPKTVYSRAPYPGSLGAIYNRLAAENPADIYCVFADDVFPLTLGWDALIHTVHTQAPENILAWFDTSQPMVPKYPIIPHSWYELAGGKIYTDHFPYGLDDQWLAEIYKMATNQDILIPKQLTLGGRKGVTNRMHDLAFWRKFFSRTRVLRMKEAGAVKERGGMAHDFSAVCQEVIRAGLDNEIALSKQAPGIAIEDKPDSAYLAAKERAEYLLKEHKLDA